MLETIIKNLTTQDKRNLAVAVLTLIIVIVALKANATIVDGKIEREITRIEVDFYDEQALTKRLLGDVMYKFNRGLYPN